MRHVAMIVAMVMPEIGFEDEPIIPTIRDETVTKKKPNTIIITADNKLVGIFGIKTIKAIRPRLPISTKVIGNSLSVLFIALFSSLFLAPKFLKDSLKALIMVGSVFIKVMIPPKVTAPAPI